MIPKNTPLPCYRKKKFKTSKDNQEFIRVEILCGNSNKAIECHKITELTLITLLKGPAGSIHFEIIYTLKQNGMLTVKVQTVSSP